MDKRDDDLYSRTPGAADKQPAQHEPAQHEPAQHEPAQREHSQREPEPAPAWHIWQAFLVLPLVVVISAVPFFFNSEAVSQVGVNLISLLLQDGCFILLPLLLVCGYYKQPPQALGFRSFPVSQVFRLAIPAGILFYLINVAIAVLINLIFPDKIDQSQTALMLLALARNKFELVMLVAFFTTLVPMAEEIYFRAFVYPPLKRACGRRAAIVFAAALFALIHVNFWTFLPLFAGGLGFAWLYDRYRNIWLNIIAHMTWNTLVLVLYFSFG
jgi:uncharacterized protein